MMFGMTSTKVPFVVIIGRKHDCYMNLDFQSVYGIIFILKKKQLLSRCYNKWLSVLTNAFWLK